MPSSDIPGLAVNPCATSCEFMYWRLEDDVQEDDVVSKVDPNSDTDTSSAQWTLAIGLAVVAVFVVAVDVERAVSRARNKSHPGHSHDAFRRI